MSLKIDRVQLEIVVQQDSARQRMIELEKKMKDTSKELNKLKKQFGENSNEYKQQEARLKSLRQEYDKLFEGIGIGKLSLKELGNRQRELNAILKNLDPSLPLWKQYNQQLKEINARIRELRNESKETQFSVAKLADGFNRYAAIGASVIASMTGVALTARKCVDEYAEMKEAQSQVIKYTGLTKKETEDLNEEFKKMDTRTPREELNRLAGEAGKLGISSKEQVLEFVDAANMINVALGEDLGEDAVKNIGKLSQMFGDGSRTLKEDMLAIGSAVNQVAQSSSAAEPYLVEFTARMGGVGKQAGMAVTDIMGFASALDQNMLRSEMASTALQGLILKIYQEPAKYAQLAGMDVKEFVNLVNTDVNEALLKFLGTLGKMGGMAEMSPILKEMKLSGAEAAGVISALAGNIDQVRREQENANKAFQDGTSIGNEYAVQNNTVQAGLEKAKNQFRDVRVELGQQLLPVMRYMVSTGSMTVKSLSAMVKWFIEYKGVILSATSSIVAYYTGVKLATLYETRLKDAKLASIAADKIQAVWNKALLSGTLLLSAAKYALTGNIKLATAAWRQFSLSIAKNPLGLLLTVITAVGVGLYQLATRTSEADDAVKSFLGNLESERRQLQKLTDAAMRAGEGTRQRKELIDEINSRYGQYLTNLLNEHSSLSDIKQAYIDINKAMRANIAQKVLDEKMEEISRDMIEDKIEDMNEIREVLLNLLPEGQVNALTQRISELVQKYADEGKNAAEVAATLDYGLRQTFLKGAYIPGELKKGIKDYADTVIEETKRVNEVRNSLIAFVPELGKTNTIDEVIITGKKKIIGNTNANNYLSDDEKKKIIKEQEKFLKAKYEAEKNAIKEEYMAQADGNDKHLELNVEHNRALYQAEIAYLASRKSMLQKYGEDTSEIQGQIYDKMIAEANRLQQAAKNATDNVSTDLLATLEEEYNQQVSDTRQAYIDGDIQRESDYQERLKEIEEDYLQQRLDMLIAFGMDTSQVTKKMQDNELKEKSDKKAEQGKQLETQLASTTDYDSQLNILQQMYDADIINYEKYQQRKDELAEEHEAKRRELALQALDMISQGASTASQLVQTLQEREISKIENRYDRQIEAAEKAGKDTTQLEEEKEEAVSAVKKKYADKQFAANVLQIISDTAVAVMRSWAELGPILGPIYAALAAAQGAAQVAVAKQQRDEAKGLKSGGYSREYIEGYTSKGNPDDVAGVIPVHKNEFVANHLAVANPSVRQFLDVFDTAQKNGTIRMLNTTQILEQVRSRSGLFTGGYAQNTARTGQAEQTGDWSSLSPDQRLQVVTLLAENNRLLRIICDKELVVDARKVRDGIRKVENMEKNVYR